MAGPSGTTPTWKVPFPIPDDNVDVPRDVKAVADWLEAHWQAAGLAISFVTTVGDGNNTSITVTHNLHTTNVIPLVSDVATGEVEHPGIIFVDGDNLRLIFAKAPAVASKKVIILAGSDQQPPQVGSYTTNIGDGASSGPFLINHFLGTRDYVLQAFMNVAPFDEVELDYERTDVNTITAWTRGIVPPANGVRVLLSSRPGAVGAAAQHGASHLANGSDPIVTLIVTSLPANPVNGQECLFLADASNGVIWRLRYRAFQADGVTPNPSTYKWEYVEGNELHALVDGASTGSGAWTAPTGVATPSLTVPLAGDYWYGFGAGTGYVPVAGVLYQYGLSIAGANPVNPHLILVQASVGYTPNAKDGKLPALAAGNVLTPKIWTSSGAPAYQNQWLRVRPIRVG